MKDIAMLDPFLLYALAAGIGVAVVAGVMGCFVVWRRMAYFGDSLAHSALLGIALGLLAGLSVTLGTVIVCSVFAILLVWLQQKKVLATDTLLGILAHAALSVGMVTISLLHQRVDIHAYLFGDILTVTPRELWWIYGGGVVVLLLLLLHWPSLVLMTIHEDLAKAEGVKTFRTQLLLMFLMTIVVAVSIRVVGILLITSMLIIPAATARQFARSPEAMAVLAAILGIVAVIMGMLGSLHFDTPSGPTIVTASACMFAVLFPVALLLHQRASSGVKEKGADISDA
jgi:zinc transport system permease protein